MNTQDDSLIFDFKTERSTTHWMVVNDGVMGGLSKGKISINDSGNGLFEGFLSTENNGGFSLVKYAFSKRDVSQFTSVKLRLKGDGKLYQLRIKADQTKSFSYIHPFQTSGALQTIMIRFCDFFASYRGSRLDIPNYDGKLMEEVSLFIGTERSGDFTLEIDRIWMS